MLNQLLTHSRQSATYYVPFIILTALLSACGGGSGSGVDGGSTASDCNFTVASTPQNLTATEVERIVAQAEQAATALNTPATIAVSDRVGNILAVYRMPGASTTVAINSGRSLASRPQGLDGLTLSETLVPGINADALAAMAKAITGAYLSSSGNAFSTRTASFIIQDHFPPTVIRQPGGPLFGVQFSQLPCGDFVSQVTGITEGPKRSPLGLAGDPGGFPIYKNGRVVGGIGVMSDGLYSIDLTPTSGITDSDERIAQSALKGFEAPSCITADKITLGGQVAGYTNAERALINVSASNVTNTANYIPISGYYAGGSALEGKAYGNPDSGYIDDPSDTLGANAFVVSGTTNNAGTGFPVLAGTAAGANSLTTNEVTQIINQAIGVANQARAQIRRPVDSPAQVTVSVVDLNGNLLGLSRTPDAPVFGTDVSLQKARTAAFFSSATAGSNITGNLTYLVGGPTINLADYVTASNLFGSTAFNGSVAFSARAIGNISRPYFPDGIDGSPNGPLSKSLSTWSPFTTGLQLDLVYGNLTGAIINPTNGVTNCTANNIGINNGIQIFPGAVPIYRGSTLIGAIGISGDGVDQDDMIAFLGLARAGNILATGIANAPNAIRSSQLEPQGVPLRYVNCPQSPFINSSAQNVCSGI